jgi:hypothetical protein
MDRTALEDNAHDPGLAHQLTGGVAAKRGGHQPGLKTVHLDAGIAQASHLHDRRWSDMHEGTGRKTEHVETVRGDIFTELPRRDMETLSLEFCQEFRVEKVNLREVWPCRVFSLVVNVLHGLAGMGVAFHADAGDKLDG